MRQILFISFIAITILIFSCNSETKQNISQKKTLNDKIILDTSKLSNDSMDLQVNRIDTIKYSNLPYWDTTMDRFRSIYIDTFTVDGIKFRFINPEENKQPYDIIVYLEKLINGQWTYTGFTLGTMNHVYDYYHSKDINGDGFIDITQDLKWNQAVYFYDPRTKTYKSNNKYVLQKDYYINKEWTLIDTSRKIFCDFSDGKQMCDDIHSTLYTFDGFNQKDLYDLELYNCTETDDDSLFRFVTKLVLSKCLQRKYYDKRVFVSKDSLVTVKEIVLSQPIDLQKEYDDKVGYFDYVAFWKQHYKELLGSSQH